MKHLLIFSFAIILSLSVQAEETQAELEVKQRDVVIREMAEIIFHNFKGRTKEELIKFLRSHPKALKTPKIINIEKNHVFWGATVKFKFENGQLSNVYW